MTWTHVIEKRTMTESKNFTIRFPIYIIGNAVRAMSENYEGYSCCLIYTRKQFAELFIKQATKAGDSYQPTTIWTSEKLQSCLHAVKSQGIDHVAWDATFGDSAWNILAIDDLLSMLGDQPSDE